MASDFKWFKSELRANQVQAGSIKINQGELGQRFPVVAIWGQSEPTWAKHGQFGSDRDEFRPIGTIQGYSDQSDLTGLGRANKEDQYW